MSDETYNEDTETIEYDPIDVSEYQLENYTPRLPQVQTPDSEGPEEDIGVDYENARKTYYELVEKGKEALDGILQVAASSEHPRSYEVAAQVIKTISDTNDRIVALQEQMRKIKEQDQRIQINNEESGDGTGTVNNNAIFVGNMNEFQQMLKHIKSGKGDD